MRTCFVALCATALTSMCGAATFTVRHVDAFPYNYPPLPGVIQPGSPLQVNGSLYQHPFGTSIGGPQPDSIDQIPILEFDSYVAIASGPSTGGDPEVEGDGSFCDGSLLYSLGNPFGTPGIIGAMWARYPKGNIGVPSIPNPLFSNRESVFVGRFTFRTTDGSQPIGSVSPTLPGLGVDIHEPFAPPVGGPATDSLIHIIPTLNTPSGIGLDGSDLGFYPSMMSYELRFHIFETSVGTSRLLVNDLYVVQVPGAGVAFTTLAGVGLASMLRNRR